MHAITVRTSLPESGHGTDTPTLGIPTAIALTDAVGINATVTVSNTGAIIVSLEVSGISAASLSEVGRGNETLAVQPAAQLTESAIGTERAVIVVTSSVSGSSYGTDGC